MWTLPGNASAAAGGMVAWSSDAETRSKARSDAFPRRHAFLHAVGRLHAKSNPLNTSTILPRRQWTTISSRALTIRKRLRLRPAERRTAESIGQLVQRTASQEKAVLLGMCRAAAKGPWPDARDNQADLQIQIGSSVGGVLRRPDRRKAVIAIPPVKRQDLLCGSSEQPGSRTRRFSRTIVRHIVPEAGITRLRTLGRFLMFTDLRECRFDIL